jgi:hypothetical protein
MSNMNHPTSGKHRAQRRHLSVKAVASPFHAMDPPVPGLTLTTETNLEAMLMLVQLQPHEARRQTLAVTPSRRFQRPTQSY